MRVISMAAAVAALGLGHVPAAAGQAPPETGCEFHVWPSEGLMSVYHGWIHGGIVNGQIQGREGYPALPPSPIETDVQRRILAESRPERLLGQPGHALIVHEEALSSRAIRTTEVRLTQSTSNCYAELVVDDVVLQQDAVNGAFLKVLFRYRDFGALARPRRTFTSWVQRHIDGLPPRRPEDVDAAIANIREAFREDIGLFATAALRPPRRR